MFGKRRLGDFSAELRSHLQLEIDRLREEGWSEAEARRQAHLNLGNLMQQEERFYERNRWNWLERIRQDVRHSLRRLLHTPSFTLMAILTLAIGIGATTSIFTLIHAVLLKSLPVSKPDQLYMVGDAKHSGVYTGIEGDWDMFSYDLYTYLRDHTDGFEEFAAFQADPRRIGVRRTGDARAAEPYIAEYVTGNYFSTFGVSAFAGRAIEPRDDRAGAPLVALMSYRAWTEKYGSDASVVGASFNLSATPVTIIGITPPGFFGDALRGNSPDFWLPLADEPAVNRGGWVNNTQLHWLYLMGRVKPGANISSIEAQMLVAIRQWLAARPPPMGFDLKELLPRQTVHLRPGGSGIGLMRATYSASLKLLMAISGFVLLIVCANLANLMLVRGLARRRQTAISLALGAGRWRVVQQAFTESIVLALAGGAAGIAIAFGATRTLLSAVFAAQSVPLSASPDASVLGFALAISVITGIVFGSAPAWSANRAEPLDALRGAGRSTANAHSLPQRSLVVLQTALSLILLACAGLLTQSLRNLEQQKFGFASDHRYAVRIDPNLAGYKIDQLDPLYREIRRRLSQLPGCLSASFALYSPMSGSNWTTDVAIDGRPFETQDGQDPTAWNRVGPDYFETVGTPILHGRAILESDTPTTGHVAVINETFARRYFPNQDPIGKHFGARDRFQKAFEVVGVAADAKYREPGQPPFPMYFVPRTQTTKYDDAGTMSFETRSLYVNDIVLRFANAPDSPDQQIRRAFADVDPNLTVIWIHSFDAQIDGQFHQETLIARLTSLFGITALLLASVGLYGMISYAMAQRSREIGIRMALGADARSVIAMVLKNAYCLVAIGLAIGIPAALGMGRVLESKLFGIRSYNPLVLAGAALVLAACALLATIAPAKRATSLDPIQTLRAD